MNSNFHIGLIVSLSKFYRITHSYHFHSSIDIQNTEPFFPHKTCVLNFIVNRMQIPSQIKSFCSPSQKAHHANDFFWKSSMRLFQQHQMCAHVHQCSQHTVPFSMFDFHSKFEQITCIWAGLHFILINKQKPRSSRKILCEFVCAYIYFVGEIQTTCWLMYKCM